VCEQKETRDLEDWAMEQEDGFGFGIGSVAQVIDVAVGPQAADDRGTRWSLHGLALAADGDFAVIADAHVGLLAPHKGPPRTVGNGSQDGAVLGDGLLPGGVRGGAQFAVDFVLVDVWEELVEQPVGTFEFEDLVGGQKGRQTFLPEVVAAFDFAFGLWSWGVTERNAVEVKRRPELGEGFGNVGEEKGMVVHVKGQGQSVGLESARQEIKMGQEGFAFVETGTGVVTRGVVEQIEEALLLGISGQPSVRAGVVLPERTQIAGLPAFDGLGRGFVAGVGREFAFDGPAADAGAVGFKFQTAEQFAGGSAVRGRRFGRKEFGEQGGRVCWPSGMMIAAGNAGGPDLGQTLGAGAQVLAVEFVEACPGQTQFAGGLDGGEFVGAMASQEMTDDGSRQTFDQL
jgi:hypothetical protein